jgi:hypothetical protein
MNLHQRIRRLEHALGELRCTCVKSADLAWPGHHSDPHCPGCAGRRLIYPLPHHPRNAEYLIRAALPIIERTYGHNERADLTNLSDPELQQLKTALQASQQHAPRISHQALAAPADFKNRCSIH